MLTKVELKLKRETIRMISEAIEIADMGLVIIGGLSEKSVRETREMFGQISWKLPTKIGRITITEVRVSIAMGNIKVISEALDFACDILITELNFSERLVEGTCDFFASLMSLVFPDDMH